MRALIVTQCFYPQTGGIENMMTGLAQHWAAAIGPVMVLADGALEGQSELAGMTVQRFSGMKLLRNRKKAKAVSNAAKSADVIYCDSYKSAERLPAKTTAPVVVFAHGMEFPANPKPEKVERIKAAFAHADLVLANSTYTAEQAAPYASDTPLQVFNPPCLPLADRNDAMAQTLSKFADNRALIAGLARIEPRKGFDMVIRALAELPDAVFALGGSGPDLERLKTLAEETGVADRVRFLGRISEEEKTALMEAAAVFAMPARREGNSVEGFGIVYLEAALAGAPSLGGIEGGAGDAIENGVLVDGTSDQAVITALSKLLAGQTDRAAIKAAAQKHLWSARVKDLHATAQTL